MECSVILGRYMGLGYSLETFGFMKHLEEQTLLFKGDFIFLWHNSHFLNPKDWAFLEGLMDNSGAKLDL